MLVIILSVALHSWSEDPAETQKPKTPSINQFETNEFHGSGSIFLVFAYNLFIKWYERNL